MADKLERLSQILNSLDAAIYNNKEQLQELTKFNGPDRRLIANALDLVTELQSGAKGESGEHPSVGAAKSPPVSPGTPQPPTPPPRRNSAPAPLTPQQPPTPPPRGRRNSAPGAVATDTTAHAVLFSDPVAVRERDKLKAKQVELEQEVSRRMSGESGGSVPTFNQKEEKWIAGEVEKRRAKLRDGDVRRAPGRPWQALQRDFVAEPAAAQAAAPVPATGKKEPAAQHTVAAAAGANYSLKAAAARAHADALAAAADAASVATADDVDFTQNDSFEFGNTLGTKGRNITVNKGGDIAWKSEETPEGRETVGSSVMALEHPIQLHRPQQNWYIWHFKIKHPKLKNKVRVGVIDASYVAWHNIKTANNRDWTTDLSAVKNVKETDTFTCALNCQKRELHVFHNTTLLETHTRIWHNYVRRIWTIEEKGTYLQRFPPDDPELGTRPEAEKTPTTEGDSTQAAKSGFALSVSFT